LPLTQSPGQILLSARVIGTQPNRFSKVSDGRLHLPELGIGRAKVIVNGAVGRHFL
jgi:hypothetical protein